MCRTINAKDAARALRAIPSDKRTEASRMNGRQNRKGHGGRPRFKGDEYGLMIDGEPAGAVRVLDDAAEVALTFLKTGQRLEAFRGASRTPTARWIADEAGRVKRVPTF